MEFKKDLSSLIVDLVIILVNLVPIFGLLYFDWGLFLVIACYIVELLVAELIVIIKIVFLSFCFPKKRIGLIVNGLILSQAFSGIFFITFIPFMAMFSIFPGNDGWSSFEFLAQSSKELIFFVSLLMVRYLVSFFMLFIGKKEYFAFENLELNDPKFGKLLIGSLMIRLTSLVFIIGISIFAVAFFRLPIYAGIFFIIAKVLIDLYSHKKEHSVENYENKKPLQKVGLFSVLSSVLVIILAVVILAPIGSGLIGTGNSKTLDLVSTQYSSSVDLTVGQSIKLASFDSSRNLFLRVELIGGESSSGECMAKFNLLDHANSGVWLISAEFYPSANPISENTLAYLSKDLIYINSINCDTNIISLTIEKSVS